MHSLCNNTTHLYSQRPRWFITNSRAAVFTHGSSIIPVISSSKATNEHVLNFSAKNLNCSSKFFVVTETIVFTRTGQSRQWRDHFTVNANTNGRAKQRRDSASKASANAQLCRPQTTHVQELSEQTQHSGSISTGHIQLSQQQEQADALLSAPHPCPASQRDLPRRAGQRISAEHARDLRAVLCSCAARPTVLQIARRARRGRSIFNLPVFRFPGRQKSNGTFDSAVGNG